MDCIYPIVPSSKALQNLPLIYPFTVTHICDSTRQIKMVALPKSTLTCEQKEPGTEPLIRWQNALFSESQQPVSSLLTPYNLFYVVCQGYSPHLPSTSVIIIHPFTQPSTHPFIPLNPSYPQFSNIPPYHSQHSSHFLSQVPHDQPCPTPSMLSSSSWLFILPLHLFILNTWMLPLHGIIKWHFSLTVNKSPLYILQEVLWLRPAGQTVSECVGLDVFRAVLEIIHDTTCQARSTLKWKICVFFFPPLNNLWRKPQRMIFTVFSPSEWNALKALIICTQRLLKAVITFLTHGKNYKNTLYNFTLHISIFCESKYPHQCFFLAH